MAGVNTLLEVEKFEGITGEDFTLWSMRMKATLVSREVWSAVDPAGVEAKTEAARKKANTASVVLVNGLGESPRKVAMQEGDDCPRKMWARLNEKYASVSETAALDTVTASIANKRKCISELDLRRHSEA